MPQSWQLAAKREAVPNTIVRNRNDLIGHFFLALSLAFNDLKGLIMFEQYLAAMGRPPPGDFSPHAGQWYGTTVQTQRWIAGVLHEIMNVITNQRYRTVLAGTELRTLLEQVGPENQAAWRNLVTIARTPMNQGNMTTLLHRIRNWTGFHYAGMNLADGFTDFFGRVATQTPTEGNRSAQYSLGVDMDGTRFYYADAAAQQVMNQQLAAAGQTIEEVFDVAKQVNMAVAALLRAFIDSRDA